MTNHGQDIESRLIAKIRAIEMGEKIALGISDTSLMREAAQEITKLRGDVSKWKSLAEANAKCLESCQKRHNRMNAIN